MRPYLGVTADVALTFFLILTILGCARAPIPPITRISFNDGRESIVVGDVKYRVLDTQEYIVVPQGFVTDLASTPWFVWALYPPFGEYEKPAIVHDYLYWTHACTRQQADKMFWLAMFENDVESADRDRIYWAVRWGAGGAWKRNGDERLRGLPRFVPREYIPYPESQGDPNDPLTIGPLDEWDGYRARLKQAHLPEPDVNISPNFCSAYDRAPVRPPSLPVVGAI